jgi:hypothetical protein
MGRKSTEINIATLFKFKKTLHKPLLHRSFALCLFDPCAANLLYPIQSMEEEKSYLN